MQYKYTRVPSSFQHIQYTLYSRYQYVYSYMYARQHHFDRKGALRAFGNKVRYDCAI